MLDETSTQQWLNDIEDACRLTAGDGLRRTVRRDSGCVEVYQRGERPNSFRSRGPELSTDLWRRIARRLETKVKQTRGGPPAWLRIDDIGTTFYLTDWSARPLPDRLADLQHNLAVVLADAPHVRGVILTGADRADVSPVPGSTTVWPRTDPPESPPRERLAHGPLAMCRPLPGYRQRLTFVLPTQHSHVILPAGTGLEPGIWYDREPDWLDHALQRLGHPPFAELVTD